MRKLLYLCCIYFICSSYLFAQDEHFTRYDFAPTFFNPANTGNFYGSYRIGILYRDQFRSFYGGGSNYSTPTLFADANFSLGFKESDWTSFGLTIVSDKAGDGKLSTQAYMANAAYHLSLDKKRKNVITLGVQYGSNSISLNEQGFSTESSLLGSDLDPLNFDESLGYTDINAGLTLVSNIGKTSRMEIGVAMGHMLGATYSYQNDSTAVIRENKIEPRINGHFKYRFLATKGISLEPTLYYSATQNISNMQVQLNSAILLSEDKELALTAGLGYRLGDAALILLGMNYGLWKVGVAYDITLSGAADANNNFGGFEVGISRIIYRESKPKINPVLLCPHL